MSRGKWALVLAVAVVLSALAATYAAGSAKVLPFGQVNSNELIAETQRGSRDSNRLFFVWWIPCEFWQVVSTPGQQTEDMIEVLKPYTLVAVVDGRLGPLGGATYRSRESIRDMLWVRGTNGERRKPLAKDRLPQDVVNLLDVIAPIVSNLMGKLGENMNFYVFPVRDAKGNRVDDPTGKGQFSIGLGSEEYTWRLPLASLLEKKTCTKCGERLNGAYKFCPWDGTKLPGP